MNCGRDGSYCTTIDQSVKFASYGPVVPSLTKNSKVLSIKPGDGKVPATVIVATPLEHMAFQGEAVFETMTDDEYPSFLDGIFRDGSLKPWQIRSIAGNSMAMTAIGHFMFYCLPSVKIVEEG